MTARSWWGWGNEDAHLDRAALDGLAAELSRRFETPLTVRQPARVEDLDLPAPRLDPPAAVAATTDPTERARHAHGQSFREVARAFRGELAAVPDVVALPRDEDEVAAVLDWCADAGAACVPFGGGTSVVGGVEPPAGDRPVVTLDTRELRGIVEVDALSRAARIRAGTTGPAIEDGLRGRDLTLRFFPQSWEFSTLGGWIVTRAGGHFATGPTHIDDLVESVTAITPAGRWESRRLPASGAGPSPDRLLLGSEGTLGVVTEAWVRLQDRPTFRAGASVTFADFAAGCAAVRDLVQSGLDPANCRLLDPGEAMLSGAGDTAVLIVGFESADHPLDAWLQRALEITASHGGRVEDRGGRDGAAGSWRETFIRAPYLRDALVACGVIAETFESAFTWDRLDEALARVTAAAREAAGAAAHVSVRLTHAYPDGAAPYWTVLTPGPVEAWDEVKAAVSEALVAAGGTITHHHAVGRHHRPWYDAQRPEPFAVALRAAKAALDPTAMLNPGVLLG